ncbi:hypothetical protein BH09VER1_BH09VER1_14050 [soil metagenome]
MNTLWRFHISRPNRFTELSLASKHAQQAAWSSNHEPAHNDSRLSQSAFTLVELLTTVAIMLMLITLLWSGVARAVDKANTVKCSGNLKQIGNALFAYASDNGGSIPPVSSLATWPPYPSQEKEWEYAIWEYAGYSYKNWNVPANCARASAPATVRNIFRCPMIFGNPQSVPNTSQGVQSTKYSYGLNSRPATPGQHWPGENSASYVTPIRLSKISKPSQTVMVDENSSSLGSLEAFKSWTGLIPHSGGCNLLYFDGHVEYRKLKDIPTVAGTPDGALFWDGQ